MIDEIKKKKTERLKRRLEKRRALSQSCFNRRRFLHCMRCIEIYPRRRVP